MQAEHSLVPDHPEVGGLAVGDGSVPPTGFEGDSSPDRGLTEREPR